MNRVSLGGWEFHLAKGDSHVGLVLVHEVFGYDYYVETVADKLANEGISVAAIDFFRGKKAKTVEEGREIRGLISNQQLADGISKGAELLRRDTNAKKIGSMGFCMGGGVALQAACELGLDFCVDYYGMIANEADVSRLRGPILLILGSEDERVTPWAFEKFLPTAMSHKKRVEMQLYPNAMHAFHRPGWEGHNPGAANDAWEKTIRFLAQIR